MKKLMILAVAAIALAACSKTFNTANTEGTAIGFSTWAEHLTKTGPSSVGNTFAVNDAFNKNASAMLFVSAKVSHLSFLPQGKVEAKKRVLAMVAQMDKEGFGNCTNLYECQAACPKGITVDYIAKMNREYLGATVTYAEKVYGKD